VQQNVLKGNVTVKHGPDPEELINNVMAPRCRVTAYGPCWV